MNGWRAAPGDEFAWASWPDGHVVYHRPSGKTHLLNAQGGALLLELLANPGEVYEVDPSVAALMFRFEALGLVERVTG